MSVSKQTFNYGEHKVTIETGRLARQADGAVVVTMGDTVVLVTAVGRREAVAGRDFFPLTVNYVEKTYAAGKIPGGFFKREGRPSEKEVLTSRLIDRPVRPLFPEGFYNEVQVVATVLSLDPEIDSDIPSLIGASAALAISGIPFSGPIAAARVGYKSGAYLLNPTTTQVKTESDLDLVVAGTQEAVLMVESEANCLSEEVMLGAVLFGHEQMRAAIAAINKLTAEAGKPRWDWKAAEPNVALKQAVAAQSEKAFAEAYGIVVKQARVARLAEIRQSVQAALSGGEKPQFTRDEVSSELHSLEYRLVRDLILAGKPRIDGRDSRTVRPITVEVGALPRTHGSAIFTRGETQALVTTTLGTGRDAQIIDALAGERRERFMLHYNFPSFSTGEVKPDRGPGRREIGHGHLAKRALKPLLPGEDVFPYTIRVVSDILESNGSSSMATVCGGSLALFDAGVPMKAACSGIAMGLITDGSSHAVLSDIAGLEDHFGDMDFKMAGTKNGVTAFQMDVKLASGIPLNILREAMEQATRGRHYILGLMEQHLPAPRAEMSEYAPRIIKLQLPKDKIGAFIGPGGKNIRAIIEKTGADIEVEDDGSVFISCTDKKGLEEAKTMVEYYTMDVEVGQVYTGRVVSILNFGAFVEILPGKEGLLHISEVDTRRINRVEDVLKVGEEVRVKVVDMDNMGKFRLSRRVLLQENKR